MASLRALLLVTVCTFLLIPAAHADEAVAPEVEEAALRRTALRTAHDAREKMHVLVITRVESTIEDLNRELVLVYSVRREYQCPTGELVSETRCDPCEVPSAEWVDRPQNIWLAELVTSSEEEERERRALFDHLGRYFALSPRGGGEKAGTRRVFYEYAGKRKAPSEPPKALRVRMFVGGNEATAAKVPAGSRVVEILAKAQRRGESGALEEFPDAKITFTAPCGEVQELGPGRVLFSPAIGIARCELTATAFPGGAVATIGVMREAELEITYEDQPADQLVLEGADVIELGFSTRGIDRAAVRPQWKATGGTLELLEEGRRVKFRLEKGAAEAEISLVDTESGAGDVLAIRRRK